MQNKKISRAEAAGQNGNREVLHISELSHEDIEAIRSSEIPAESATFDHELKP